MTEKQKQTPQEIPSPNPIESTGLAQHAKDMGLEHNPQPEISSQQKNINGAEKRSLRLERVMAAATLLLASATIGYGAGNVDREIRQHSASPAPAPETVRPRRERVELNDRTPAIQQAQQMTRALNKDKAVTGVHIESGSVLPINDSLASSSEKPIKRGRLNPIRFDETHYGYIEYDEHAGGKNGKAAVHVIEYDGPLVAAEEFSAAYSGETPQLKTGSVYLTPGWVAVNYRGGAPGHVDFPEPGVLITN